MENAQGIVLIEKGSFKLWYYHIMEIYHISWENEIYVWKNVRKYTQMLMVGLWVVPPTPFSPLFFPLSFFLLQNYTTSLCKIVQLTSYKWETCPSNEKGNLGKKLHLLWGYCLLSPECQQQWEVLPEKGKRKGKENKNGKGRGEEKEGVHRIVVGTSGALASQLRWWIPDMSFNTTRRILV